MDIDGVHKVEERLEQRRKGVQCKQRNRTTIILLCGCLRHHFVEEACPAYAETQSSGKTGITSPAKSQDDEHCAQSLCVHRRRHLAIPA